MTVWHRQLFMGNWFKKKSLWVLAFFGLWFFGSIWVGGIGTVCTQNIAHKVDEIYTFLLFGYCWKVIYKQWKLVNFIDFYVQFFGLKLLQ